MTTEIDWDNAPEGAEYFNSYQVNFYKVDGQNALFFDEQAEKWCVSMSFSADKLKLHECTVKRPQPKPKYEYGVEYPTNGQKPDLPDYVLVDIRMHADDEMSGRSPVSSWSWGPKACYSFRIVDERYKPAETAQDALKPQNPYQRTVIGLDGSKCAVDVYRVLDAFKTDSPALDHAIKKILCPGTRHQKDRKQDLKEAIKSIEAELLLMSQR